MITRQFIIIGLILVACSSGCGERRSEEKKQESPPVRHDVVLRVLVVGDPELATGVKLLRGEWAQRSGGQLKVQQWTSKELSEALGERQMRIYQLDMNAIGCRPSAIGQKLPLAAFLMPIADSRQPTALRQVNSLLPLALLETTSQSDPALPADLIIYPTRYLGALASGNAIRPVRQSILHGSQLASADLFPAIRNREIIFGGKVVSLPLGSPPLLLCCNPKLFVKTGPALPETWEDYRRMQQQLSRDGHSCILPLSGNAAALTLLARAVSYASGGRGNAVLFDAESFHPQIAGPPFVRALKEMAEELSGQTLELSLQVDFSGAVETVATGQAAVSFGWPGTFRPVVDQNKNGEFHLNFAELPRSTKIYSTTRQQWDTNRSESPVTLLGAAGRLASVTTTSRNATSAFKLLEWLCCGNTGTQLSSRSSRTLWHRGSQLKSANKWLGISQGISQDNSREIAQLAATALGRESCFLVPRIPGIDQYLASLSDAVRQAVQGEEAAAALQQTAQHWSEITERLGLESQREAYRQHLGL